MINYLKLLIIFLLSGEGVTFAAQFNMVKIKSGIYKPFLKEEYYKEKQMPAFELMDTPVTMGMYQEFLNKNENYHKNKIKSLFAEQDYLKNWENGIVKQELLDHPVTYISWFTAREFCKFYGMRLPNLDEWEFASLSDTKEAQDEVYHWLSEPGIAPFNKVKLKKANIYGLFDMHALVWEWVEDFNQVMLNSDSRGKNDKSTTGAFCGAGTLTSDRAMEYATYMRFALRGSIKANYTLGNLGFRCAK